MAVDILQYMHTYVRTFIMAWKLCTVCTWFYSRTFTRTVLLYYTLRVVYDQYTYDMPVYTYHYDNNIIMFGFVSTLE
jgi:hypothetical protein